MSSIQISPLLPFSSNCVSLEKTRDECPICYEFIGEKNSCTTECGHSFCFKCALKAYNMNGACPCCRSELCEKDNTDEPDESDIESEDSDNETETDESRYANIDHVIERFESRDWTLKDALILLTGRFILSEKYTHEKVDKLYEEFNNMIVEMDNETIENTIFGFEDVNVLCL